MGSQVKKLPESREVLARFGLGGSTVTVEGEPIVRGADDDYVAKVPLDEIGMLCESLQRSAECFRAFL